MNESNEINKAHTADVIRRFNDAFLLHQPDALVELIGAECIIESIAPAPSGLRHLGKAACLAVWEPLAGDSATRFELEEVFVAGDRAVIRWRYFFGAGESNSVRGVNLMRVRGGRIVEAMGYVKSG